MEGYKHSPEKYLDRTDKISQNKGVEHMNEKENLRETISEPFKKIEWGVEGKIDFSLGENDDPNSISHIRIDYDSFESPKLKRYNRIMSRGEFISGINMERYRRINNIIIRKNNKEFDLDKVLGEEWGNGDIYVRISGRDKVFFYDNRAAMTDPKRNLLISGFNIDSPLGLFTVLHEVGHYLRHKSLENTGEKDDLHSIRIKHNSREALTSSEKADIIFDERKASGFAFKVFKIFLGKNGKIDDINKYMHTALSSYHGSTKK